MNPDLLIKIGADLSQFDKDMNRAKEKFKQATVAINKIRKNTSLMGSIDETLKSIEKQEQAYKKMFAEVKATALANGRKVTDAQIHGVTRAALAEKRVRDVEIKKYMATQERLSKKAYEKEMARIESISLEKLKELNRQAAKKKKHDNGVNWNGHNPLRTVGVYGAATKVVYDLARGIRAVANETVRLNDSMYQNMAVLGKTKTEAKALTSAVSEIGGAYGGDLGDIQEGLITLGRAGIDETQTLINATQVLRELSLITGDSMSEGAVAMSSLINVYALGADATRELGDQMAYVANETRLSIGDFSTISNYALVAAKNIGLTKEAYLALNGVLSKAGFNASTIGTNIRRLGKILNQDSAKNLEMFRVLGFEQKKFAKAMRKDSNKALGEFVKQIMAVDPERFNAAVKDMDVLTRQLIDGLRGGGSFFQEMIDTLTGVGDKTVDLKKQAEQMSQGMTLSFQSIWNDIKSGIAHFFELEVNIDKVRIAASNTKKGFDVILKALSDIVAYIPLIGQLVNALGQIGGNGVVANINKSMGKGVKQLTVDVDHLKAKNQELKDAWLFSDSSSTKNQIIANEKLIKSKERLISAIKVQGVETAKQVKANSTGVVGPTGKPDIKERGVASARATKLITEEKRKQIVLQQQLNGTYLRSKHLKDDIFSLNNKLTKLQSSSKLEMSATVLENIEKTKTQLLSKQLMLKKALASENKSVGGGGGGSNKAARDADRLSRDAIALLEAKMKLEQAIVDMNDAKNSNLYTQVQLDMKALKVAKAKLKIAEKYKAAAIAEGLPKGARGEKKLIDLKIKVVKAQEDVNKKSVAAWNRVIKDLKEAGKSAFDQLMKLDFKGALETLTGGFLDSMLKPMKDYFSTTFAGLFKQDGAIGSMFSGMFGSGKKGGILDSMGGIGAVVSAVVGVAGAMFSNKAAKDLEKAQKRATANATANSKTIENSLKDLEDIGTLGLKHSGKMVGSLQTIADMTLISAKNMGADLSGTGYTEVTKRGFFNDSTTKLMESGISLDAATIAQINNGQMTATKYMIEVTENSGFLGIGASTDSKRTDMGSANGAIMEPITEAYRQGVEVIRSASSALGVSAAEFAATSAIWETSIQDLNFKGMDAAQRAQLIQGAIAGDMDRWAESLITLQPILEKFSHDGEAAGEALIRIVTTYELAEKAMRDMGDTLAPLVEGGYEVADAMIKAAGGMAKFAKGVKDFQEAFMTDGQKQAVLQRDLAISSAQIGLSLPQTAQGMLALHNSLMKLAATSPVAAEQLRWLNANVADLAKMVEYAGSKAGSAAGKIGGCGSALGSCGSSASSCGASAKSCGKELDDLASSLDFISAQAEFHARKLALSDDDKASAEYAVKSSKAMLVALKAEHKLGNLTIDNYEQQLAAAFKLGNMTDEMLANYTSIGSAILDVAEAEKELQDLRKKAEEEKVKAQLDKVNAEVEFYEDIFKKIKDAFTGSLSPYNSREKAAQQHAFSDAYYDAGTTNEQAYFDSLYKGLEYEKKMSVTKEAYAILFDEYLNDLKNIEYVEQEKTTNDVVKELEEANKKLDDLTDAIEKASYK